MQRFTANFGDERLEIDTEPWVEGDLKINGRWHVVDKKNSGDVFRDLEAIAEEVQSKHEADRQEPSSSAAKEAGETDVKAGSGRDRET